MTFPDPVIEIAVEPKTKNDQEKDVSGSGASGRRRPVPSAWKLTLKVRSDHHEGGMGELHLDILDRPPEARIQGGSQHRCPAGGLPRNHQRTRLNIPTPTRNSRVGAGQFAEVKLDHRADRSRAKAIQLRKPHRWWCRAEGIHPRRRERALKVGHGFSGPLAGFPVIDFKVALIDGKFHDVDSSVHGLSKSPLGLACAKV